MKNRILEMLTASMPDRDSRQRMEEAIDPEHLKASAEQWVADNPAVALGAALTVGVLVGWLIKRK